MPTPNKYPKEFKERAVRMVAEIGGHGAISRVSKALGVNRETIRYWVKNMPISKGGRKGLSDEEIVELAALRKEVRELRRANEILKSASAFFARELDHPRPR